MASFLNLFRAGPMDLDLPRRGDPDAEDPPAARTIFYWDEYGKHAPWFTLLSAVVQTVLFFAYLESDRSILSSTPRGGPSVCILRTQIQPEDCDVRTEVWRLYCYQFVHSGLLHLVSNVLMLLIAGIPLESVHGSVRIGALFQCGVVLGGLATAVFKPSVKLVGASAGCYALLGVHVANLMINWKEMTTTRWVRVAGLGALALMDVLVYHFAHQPGVGYVAHGVGYLIGVLCGAALLRNLVVWRWEIFFRRAMLGCGVLIGMALSSVYVTMPLPECAAPMEG
jgi:rhomboid-related protein 1/2/3